MLNKIVPSGSFRYYIVNELPHDIQLMVSRENQSLFLCDSFTTISQQFLIFLHLKVDELLKNIHHTILLEYRLPEICSRIAIRINRIAGTAIVTGTI